MTDENKEIIANESGEEKTRIHFARTSMHLPYGSFEQPSFPYDFHDANINHLDLGKNDHELKILERMYNNYAGCATKYPKKLEDVAAEILKSETVFNQENYKLYTSVSGARGAIIEVLKQIVSNEKPVVAYGSPNWVFDSIIGKVKDAIGNPFFAPTSEDFVKQLENYKDKERLASLIIVDPSNPLGYRFSKDEIFRIEQIAREYGFVPLFDDVFRGMQEKGYRNSASEHSMSSIIVETTSKRFGIRGLGATWTLIPKDLQIERAGEFNLECKGCENIAAMITEGLYESNYGERIREFIISGANAFKRGMEDVMGKELGGGKIVHAFDAMPLMTYFFPDELNDLEHNDRVQFCEFLKANTGTVPGYYFVCIGTEKDKVVDPREMNFNLSFSRICPTKESSGRAYIGGRAFGMWFSKIKKQLD